MHTERNKSEKTTTNKARPGTWDPVIHYQAENENENCLQGISGTKKKIKLI